MDIQDDLFQLIRSLAKSEKRYFKTNAQKGGDSLSNYVQLFDALDTLGNEYDELKLRKKHAKKSFIKYLSAEKKYLREQIMKQMRAYRSELSIDNKIHDLLQDELFYRDKGLKQHREKAIQKAKEYATINERFHLLQEVLERQIMFVQEFEEKSLAEPVLRIHSELRQLSVIQQTYLELTSKNREIFSAYRSGSDINDTILRHRLDMAISEVEMLRSRARVSFRLQQQLNRSYSNYYLILKNAEKSYEYVLNEYLLYQTYPQFKELSSYNYKICLANLVSRAQSALKTSEFLRYIEELKALPATTFNEEGEVFQNVYFLEHLHYINTGEFDKAEKLVPIIEKGLITYASKINLARKLSFQFNIMIMYFLMHDFKNALKWVETLLEDKSEIKQNQRFVTSLLLPFIHFELGHVDLVESYARAAYRLLNSKKRLYAFERLVIKYLQKMPLSPNQAEFHSDVSDFHTGMQDLMKTPDVQVTVGMEELSLWAQSRAEGVKMSELLKAQAVQGS